MDKPFFLENHNIDSSQRNIIFMVRGEDAKKIRMLAGTPSLLFLSSQFTLPSSALKVGYADFSISTLYIQSCSQKQQCDSIIIGLTCTFQSSAEISTCLQPDIKITAHGCLAVAD